MASLDAARPETGGRLLIPAGEIIHQREAEQMEVMIRAELIATGRQAGALAGAHEEIFRARHPAGEKERRFNTATDGQAAEGFAAGDLRSAGVEWRSLKAVAQIHPGAAAGEIKQGGPGAVADAGARGCQPTGVDAE